jgi:hypothetical protein
MFAATGEASNRGSQVGWRELLIGVAGIVGPATAALAGALGGLALGYFIDRGHARRATWVNTATLGVLIDAGLADRPS